MPMLSHDLERSILELTLRKTDLQKEIEEIDLQIAFLCEQKKEAQEDSWQSGTKFPCNTLESVPY